MEVYKVLGSKESTNRKQWLSLSQYKGEGASHDIGQW